MVLKGRKSLGALNRCPDSYRKGRMLAAVLALGAAVLAPLPSLSPQLQGLSQSTVTTGTSDLAISLLGRDLAGVTVTVRTCDGSVTPLRASTAGRPVIRIPAPLRRRPCLLRVALAPSETGLPLTVADPAVVGLTVPAPAEPGETGWSGRFNMLCESDTTVPPPAHSLLAVAGDSVDRLAFVLGRKGRALMRVEMKAPPVAGESGETCRYLLLPGVDPGDVQWGPEDVEGLWVAVLSADRRTLRGRQFLADMVPEPSGPLDQ